MGLLYSALLSGFNYILLFWDGFIVFGSSERFQLYYALLGGFDYILLFQLPTALRRERNSLIAVPATVWWRFIIFCSSGRV